MRGGSIFKVRTQDRNNNTTLLASKGLDEILDMLKYDVALVGDWYTKTILQRSILSLDEMR